MRFRDGLAALTILGLCGSPAIGASQKCNPPRTQADEQACTPDVHEKCGEFGIDVDAIIKCLTEKNRQGLLSAACHRVMSRPYNKNWPTCG
ncbi:MAG TPA: hypothetical protein VKX28_27200 [Xanthobacteraceae bacterium]|nr:hypothetical protein [Xanthobacteraceae bacterium]